MSREGVARALEVRHALGTFLERTRAPVIVVARDGRFVSANDAALAQYGYGLDELVDMRIHDFMAQPRPELPDDLERVSLGEDRALARRPHRRKDGSVLWVVPVAGPVVLQGETLIVSVLQDVTAIVSAEETAHLGQSRLELLWEAAVERIGSGFALLDADRRIVRINRTSLQWLQRREDQVIGLRCDELYAAICKRQPCPHVTALAEQRRVVVEVESTQGRPLRIEVSPAPPNDAGVATVHLSHDLSEEREVRSRLVATDRLAGLGRVAAGVAHEVNNPAAFLTLALPLARDRIAQGRGEEAVALIDEALSATAQITEVMRDLSGLSRDRPRAIVDLASLASGAIRIASYEAQPRARLERSFEEGVAAEVRGARVAQVLLNLILNAAQAIPLGDPDRHRIEVRVRRSGAGAGERGLVEIADTGPGVPLDIGERIFEPFFTTRASRGGTGLGLWLSRTIVEEEGGTLTWHNRPEGGAVFTVSLPLARGTETRLEARAE